MRYSHRPDRGQGSHRPARRGRPDRGRRIDARVSDSDSQTTSSRGRDTGAGGAVADAIGVRLARLGRRVQALAVTHAPQVAARADHHYLITKDALASGKRVATRIAELEPDSRREEIARLLAGAEITDEARAAAERLMQAAAE